jgi:hypothetical protein
VVGLASRVCESGLDVVRFEIGEVAQEVFVRGATRKASENVSHSNAHASDTRASAALVRFDGDALEELHMVIVPAQTPEINCRPFGLRFAKSECDTTRPALAIVILCSPASRLSLRSTPAGLRP